MLVSSVAIAAVAMAFGLTWQASVVVGLGLAMSSTAFATQIITEKHEMATAHGQAAFGILLFQDRIGQAVRRRARAELQSGRERVERTRGSGQTRR